MIFSELTLHNFGIYNGRHVFDLVPKSHRKPIVLIGGLNGGGKTTFLDALQLALYGNRANCVSRSDLSYSEYLRQAINRYAEKSEGASIELAFTYFKHGEAINYRIRRIWKDTGKRTISDQVDVEVDNKLDAVMSKHWAEHVEDFVPCEISSLFFFDGEKIEDLANPLSSSEIIRTGVQTLLGLDVINRLSIDLKTVERRRLKLELCEKENQEINSLESRISELQDTAKNTEVSLAQKISEIDSLQSQIAKIKSSYKTHGGELFDQKEAIEEKHRSSQNQLNWVSDEIRKFASGSAPLLLVKELLLETKKQAERELRSQSSEKFLQELKGRDKKVLKLIEEKSYSDEFVKELSNIFLEDQNERVSDANEPRYLHSSADGLSHVNKDYFNALETESKLLSKRCLEAQESLSYSETEISSIPETGIIKEISEQLNHAQNKLVVAEKEKQTILDTLDNEVRQLEQSQEDLARALHRINEKQLSAHRNKQILGHIGEVQSTLDVFKSTLVKKHIHHLESLIAESFKSLIRKSDLIEEVQIDTDTFTLNVLNLNGEVIPLNRLSAGERQILAISVLWGLAKASGRPLPIIIDTPLGRLDSEHREHLIENYFPNASHQVILLSTDTEIDAQYRDMLQASVGKEYQIQYSSEQKTSLISPGYF